MASSSNNEVLRLAYAPPRFLAREVNLHFDLDDVTTVRCAAQYARNEGVGAEADLVLDGETAPAKMTLLRVRVAGKDLPLDAMAQSDTTLTIPGALLPPPSPTEETFEVDITVTVEPEANTALSGLYKSSGNFCTQMEAEGFRNMMYFVDRPDVMSVYTTTIVADQKRFPYLLSNGDPVEPSADLDVPEGKHAAVWHDPWPKPSYLFALVAGDFDVREDSFRTRSGKEVRLRVLVDKGEFGRTAFAMESLKRAFKWDEERFDREYDLENFNLVAVADFNMGAMENKGLNIFNSKCVLADPETTTDGEFERIEAIIGHEYCHNWSGNRVTCRDWFQLTLKEGLTVFRDQEFTSDLHSRAAKRIADVKLLRDYQFNEDAGPMAHPIRPDAYVAIDNFYTATVYEKGAEVIRMVQTVLSREGFKKGLNLYFQRHDGQAVTCDDFLSAMADANPGTDLEQFRETWYAQAGTPEVTVRVFWEEGSQQLKLNVKQECPSTAGQPAESKKPFDVPLAVGALGADSCKPLLLDGKETVVLRVREAEQDFVLQMDRVERPVASLLREFSAPVKLRCPDISAEDLVLLAAHDADAFVRYESGQALARQVLLGTVAVAMEQQSDGDLPEHPVLPLLAQSLKATLADPQLDKALAALAITLPTQHELLDAAPRGEAHPGAIARAVRAVRAQLVQRIGDDLERAYKSASQPAEDETLGQAASRRALRNACLRFLCSAAPGPQLDVAVEMAAAQFKAESGNMTDRYGALLALKDVDCDAREAALNAFYERFQHDKLTVLKWLRAHAMSSVPDALDRVAALKQHAAFDLRNPNSCYALFNAFAGANFSHFHSEDGKGYAFVADQVLELNGMNPQVASRVAKNLADWRALAQPWRDRMREQVQRIADAEGLSPDVAEIANKSLAQ